MPHPAPPAGLLDGRADDEGWSSAAALVATSAGTEEAFADGPGAARGTTGAATRFDLASVTKAFVAVTAATLVDAGLLDPDAPAREVLDVPATSTGATARRAGTPWGQALGLRRGDPGFMVSGGQVGHAGFTGTSFVADLRTGATAVLLTNRVHGGRAASVEARRRRLAARAAEEGR